MGLVTLAAIALALSVYGSAKRKLALQITGQVLGWLVLSLVLLQVLFHGG